MGRVSLEVERLDKALGTEAMISAMYLKKDDMMGRIHYGECRVYGEQCKCAKSSRCAH